MRGVSFSSTRSLYGPRYVIARMVPPGARNKAVEVPGRLRAETPGWASLAVPASPHKRDDTRDAPAWDAQRPTGSAGASGKWASWLRAVDSRRGSATERWRRGEIGSRIAAR